MRSCSVSLPGLPSALTPQYSRVFPFGVPGVPGTPYLTRGVRGRRGWARGHGEDHGGRRARFAPSCDAAWEPLHGGPLRRWRCKWSSAAPHRRGHDDDLVKVEPPLGLVGDRLMFLRVEPDQQTRNALRRHERTGHPLGSPAFLDKIESLLNRALRPARRGPKPKRRRKQTNQIWRPQNSRSMAVPPWSVVGLRAITAYPQTSWGGSPFLFRALPRLGISTHGT